MHKQVMVATGLYLPISYLPFLPFFSSFLSLFTSIPPSSFLYQVPSSSLHVNFVFIMHNNIFSCSPVSCNNTTAPGNGSINTCFNKFEDAEIFFMCNPGLVLAERIRTVCATNGRWNPEPVNDTCTGIKATGF